MNQKLPSLSDPEDDFVKGLMNMVRGVYKDKGIPEGTINREVTTGLAKKLFAGVETSFGSQITKLDYNTPDWKMLAALQRNVWQFSAAKNYAELRELSNALIGEDGKLRTWKQFKEAAFKINDKHNGAWLRAEYELAVSGSQMAGKWVNIQRDKAALPFLRFVAVLDAHTTDLCHKLDGIRLPVDHPFWKIYYPPNHFGERGTVVQELSGRITPSHDLPSVTIPTMFQSNLAEEGLIFPKDHPYYTGIPKGVQQGEHAAMRKEMYSAAKARLKNKTVEVDGVGTVRFSSNGMKEIFNQPHVDYALKNQLAVISDQLLQNAIVIRSKEDNGVIWHYLRVKGLPDTMTLVVREFKNGRKTLYSIVDRLK